MQIILFPAVCIGIVVVGAWWSNRRDRARRLAGIVPIAALELEGEGCFSIVPGRYGRVIEQTDAPTRQWLRVGGQAFFREALLAPGDRVTVVGLVLFEPDPTQPAAGFRSPSIRARLCGSKDEPVVVAHEARPPA
jgi:hypothetical protein